MSKKTKNIIFNIFWIIFTGIPSAIYNGIMGALCCVTIIGIPFGLQYFKFIPLVFAPAGKRVITHCNTNPVLNILWFIFGGMEAGVYHYFLSFLFSLSIIGEPIARQLRKIAAFNFFPFGVEIIKDGEYSANRNTKYDYDLLAGKIFADSQKLMPSGEETVEMYITREVGGMRKKIERLDKNKIIDTIALIIIAILVFLGAVILTRFPIGMVAAVALAFIWVVVSFLIVYFAIFYPLEKISDYRDLKYMKPKLDVLMDLYPESAPMLEHCRCNGALYTRDIKSYPILAKKPNKIVAFLRIAIDVGVIAFVVLSLWPNK